MGDRLVHDRLLDDHVRVREGGVDVADRPFGRGFAHGQLVRARLVEDRVRPLERDRLAAAADVAVQAGVWAAFAQALQRVEDERELFEVDPYRLDRGCRGRLVDGRHREDRFAFVLGLVRQRRLS